MTYVNTSKMAKSMLKLSHKHLEIHQVEHTSLQ